MEGRPKGGVVPCDENERKKLEVSEDTEIKGS
jgi:hypothetical protein